MIRKRVNFCFYANNWAVWDMQRKQVVGYFLHKHDAELCAAQCELF